MLANKKQKEEHARQKAEEKKAKAEHKVERVRQKQLHDSRKLMQMLSTNKCMASQVQEAWKKQNRGVAAAQSGTLIALRSPTPQLKLTLATGELIYRGDIYERMLL